MLYEPPKTKKHLIIFGIVAVFLAILIVVATPFFYGQRISQTSLESPSLTSEQERIRREFEKMETTQENSSAKQTTPEEIQKEFSESEKQRKTFGANQPSPEQIQAEFEKFEKAGK
jgi:flagellar basal body-associated protein FliL